jgi:glucose-6-phosphate isomerase
LANFFAQTEACFRKNEEEARAELVKEGKSEEEIAKLTRYKTFGKYTN